ncbi:hypothetical protein FGB62_17g01 [Gracilaria domingensis]|nr:hypothetical protein FGB62_17g01 [Gracilaria domingensis]
MSRVPRVIHELYETLQIMSGSLQPSPRLFHDNADSSQLNLFLDLETTARAPIVSTAGYDLARDRARDIRLIKPAAKQLCHRLCVSLVARLGTLWEPVPSAAFFWGTEQNEQSSATGLQGSELLKYRRVLLFHLAALVDVNEGEFEFLGDEGNTREAYFSLLYEALAREVVSLDSSLTLSTSSLETLFGLIPKDVQQALKNKGQKEPNEALMYWKRANASLGLVSPVPFNTVVRAFLGSQASSAAAERLFSSLGRAEGTQCQSLLSGTMEMCQVIREYV